MFNMIGGAIKTRLEDTKGQWQNATGLDSFRKGHLTAAMESFQETLRIANENAPNSLLVANLCNNIGLVLYHRGDLDGALEQYQRALAIQEIKSPNSLALSIPYIMGSSPFWPGIQP